MCADDDGLFEEMGVGQMDGDLVAKPIRALGTHLRVSPRPVGLLSCLAVGGVRATVEDGDGGFHIAAIVDHDGDRVEYAVRLEPEEGDRSACVPLAISGAVNDDMIKS
jgi:hypothetical protein